MAIADLTVKIGADVSGAMKGIGSVQGKLTGLGSKMSSIGKTATIGLTAPIVAGMGAVVVAASNWDSAFAGVIKTVDASDAEINILEQDLLDLSKVVPIGPAQIAGIAELGGQLGIAYGEIPEFTKVIADLGASTNLSFEDAAMGVAQFINVTAGVTPALMASDEIASRVGSTIVDLGNNFATTEADIMQFGSRIAGTSALLGISQAEILGWSAGMASMGINAESGGTAFNMTLQDMNKAVTTNSDKLTTWAAVAGMSVTDFSTLFETDASAALQTFLGGLGDMREGGEDVIGVLDSLGITGTRQIDTLLKMSGSTDLVTAALDRANVAYGENSALSEEAEKRYKTFASQMQFLKNDLYDVAVQIGNVLLPIILDLVASLRPMIAGFAKFAEAHPGIVKIALGFLAVLAVVGPLLIGFGAIVNAIGILIPAGGVIAGVFSAIGAAIAAIGWPILAIIAVVGALYLAWKTNFLGIQDALKRTWDVIVTIFNNIKSLISGDITWDQFVSRFQSSMAVLKGVWSNVWESLKAGVVAAWDAIKAAVLQKLAEFIAPIIGSVDEAKTVIIAAWENVKTALVTVWEGIKTAAAVAWEAIKEIIATTVEYWRGILAGVIQFLSGDFAGAWETLKGTLGGIWEGLATKATEIWEGIKTTMAEKMELAKSKVSEAMESARTKVSEVWSGIAATVSEKVDAVLGFINKLWTAIADIGSKIVGGIMGAIGGIGGGGEMEMPDIEGGPMEWARMLQETFVAMKEAVVTNLTAMSEAYVTTTAAIQETHLAWLTNMMVAMMTHQLNVLTLTQTHLLAIQTITTTTWTMIQSFLATTWALILATYTAHMTSMLTITTSSWTAIATVTVSLMEAMKGQVIAIFAAMKGGIVGELAGIAAAAYAGGQAIGNSLASGIRSKIGAVRAAAAALAAAARANLPGSDAKEGPLSDLTASGLALPTTFAEGMLAGKGMVDAAMQKMLTSPDPEMNGMPVAIGTNYREERGYPVRRGGPVLDEKPKGDITIIIHNPKVQTAEDSISDAMRKVAWGMA